MSKPNYNKSKADKSEKDYKGKSSGKGYKGNSKSKDSNDSYNKNKNYNSRNYSDNSAANDSDSVRGNRKPFDSYHSNDIGWWNKSPMYADVTRVPFNQIYGSGLSTGNEVCDPTNFKTHDDWIVGNIMAINYIPSIGSARDGNSMVNRAFNSLFGELYARTTGTPPIQQMDVAMFCTSLSSVASLIGYAKRALGVSQLYSSMNYTYPRELIKAMNIDPSTVIGSQDYIRYQLNDCILNFNNLKVPDIMDVYVRQYALAHNVYTDEDDVQSQIYVFNPLTYYVYNDTASPAKLESRKLSADSDTLITMTTLIGAINTCLEAWRNSTDLSLISGTIQRAFADTQTISLDYVKETDVVVPTVDRNIMWQINNLQMCPVKYTSLDITQDPTNNYLLFDPEPVAAISDSAEVQSSYVLNSYDGNTSDEFIMEATRLIPFYSYEADALIFNTEIVQYLRVFAWNTEVHSMGAFDITSLVKSYIGSNDMSCGAVADDLLNWSVISEFKYHPFIRIYYKAVPTDKWSGTGMFGDLYKYTTINDEALYGLHRCAMQSVYRTFTASSK